MRGYRDALRFAARMPFVGRYEVRALPNEASDEPTDAGRRWASQFFTKLYLELHVRKRIETIQSALNREMLGGTSDERERLSACEAELARRVAPLRRWRTLGSLVSRLPPIAAAVPVLTALSVWPVEGDVDARAAVRALSVLGVTTVALWLLVVWPSVRLGFRVKRAILAGGRDLRHPIRHRPEWLEWCGYPASKGHPALPFPTTNVYELEKRVFALVGRKPTEVPLDMIFALGPYLLLAVCVLILVAAFDLAASGFPGVSVSGAVFLALLVVAAVVLPPALGVQMRNNFHRRRH
jgi:hypothetical protein